VAGQGDIPHIAGHITDVGCGGRAIGRERIGDFRFDLRIPACVPGDIREASTSDPNLGRIHQNAIHHGIDRCQRRGRRQPALNLRDRIGGKRAGGQRVGGHRARATIHAPTDQGRRQSCLNVVRVRLDRCKRGRCG